MHLIAQKLGPTAKEDTLVFVRSDGSRVSISMPRQGILPHDLIHYVVEIALPLRRGFLSQVASGASPAFSMQEMGAVAPPSSIEAGQVEAVVEALQAQLWQGTFDKDAFQYGLRTAYDARGIEPLRLPPGLDEGLFDAACQLAARWGRLDPGDHLRLQLALPSPSGTAPLT